MNLIQIPFKVTSGVHLLLLSLHKAPRGLIYGRIAQCAYFWVFTQLVNPCHKQVEKN